MRSITFSPTGHPFSPYNGRRFSEGGQKMKRLMMIAVAVAALCVGQAVGLDAQAKAKAMNASGTVKAVTGNSLTVTAAGGKDMTFTIDNTTKFVGKGLGTKAKAGPVTPDERGA